MSKQKSNTKESVDSAPLAIIQLVMKQRCGIPKLPPVESVVSQSEQLSPLEQQVLDLYDQLLRLKADQYTYESSASHNEQEEARQQEDTEELEKKVHDLRRKLTIKDQVIESILSTRPVYRALMRASDLSAKESMLSGLVDRNTSLSLKLLDQNKHIQATKEGLSTLDYQISVELKKVKELTAKLTVIIENRSKSEQDKLSIEDKENIQRIQETIRLSQGKVNTLKAVILALILGSGVPWIHDDDLQALVKKCSQPG